MIKSKDRKIVKKKSFYYADSILNAAMVTGGIEEALAVRKDFDVIDRVMLVNENVLSRFDPDSISGSQDEIEKIINRMVDTVFTNVTDSFKQVLLVMCYNRDIRMILNVGQTYEWLLSHWLGKTVVDVTTYVPLDDNLRDIISKKAANDLDSEVILQEHIDKSILGGVILHAKGKVLDSSINTKLLEMKQTLLSHHSESK